MPPAALASGELSHFLVFGRATQSVHRNGEFGIELPGIERVDFILHFRLAIHQLLHLVRVVHDFFVHELVVDLLVLFQNINDFLRSFLNDFAHCFGVIQLRLLRKVPDRVALRPDHFALVSFIESGNDFHDR